MILQSSYGFALLFRPHNLQPEIYKNRSGTKMQIFDTDGLLDTDVIEVPSI